MHLPSDTEFQIMEVLQEEPETYAWDIVKLSEGKLSRNGIYAILTRMVARGYLSDSLEEATGMGGPRRRFYKLTHKGIAAHAAYKAAKEILDAAGVRE